MNIIRLILLILLGECFALKAGAQSADISPSARAVASGPATNDYWAVEDAAAREKLPLYQVIPAAKPEELTPANGYPTGKTFLTWQRSHGDNSGMRYSALRQINRANVTNLQVAWTYHSQDEGNPLECNPIIAGDIM